MQDSKGLAHWILLCTVHKTCQRGASATLSVETEEETAFLITFVEGDMTQEQHFISLMYEGSEFQKDR